MKTFKIGQKVKTLESVRPVQYAKKRGNVVALNERDNEVGVSFGNFDFDNNPIIAWFRTTEIAS